MATNTKAPPATRVVLENVRGTYVHLITPQASGEDGTGKDKYSMGLLIPKDRDAVMKPKLGAAIKAAVARAFPGGTMDPWKQRNKPIRDGDTDETFRGRAGCAGHWIINARSEERPRCVDRQRIEVPEDRLGEFYSGAYYTVIIDAFAYGQKPGSKQKGVGWGLSVVQKLRDGERLDNRASVDDLPEVEPDTGSTGPADDWGNGQPAKPADSGGDWDYGDPPDDTW